MADRAAPFVFLCALCSCTQSHRASGPVPLERFCDAFFDAMCEPLVACECPSTVESACRAQERELCAGFPSASMLAAIEDGQLRYDPESAGRLIDRMHARADGCASFVDSVDWRVRDLFNVGGVFVGSLEAGTPCSVVGFELISACVLGSCAPIDGAYVCRAAVGEGEVCDALHQCVDLDAPLTTDLAIDLLALRCVPNASGTESGTCRRPLEDGALCTIDEECQSALCRDGRCAHASDGESCVRSRQCESGYCRYTDHRCAPGDASEGAICDEEAACASEVCLGVCLPASCGTF